MDFKYNLITKDATTAARLGQITTPHGVIHTPVFMPVGTQGTVKSLTPAQLTELEVEVILGNTYHLYLRPGHELIGSMGGLHRFMNWSGPILTDSGGFQVHSLAALRKMTPEGVIFQSHIDGSRHTLTPELVVKIQEALGSDIMMCLDECTSYPASHEKAEKSMNLTIEWARRSREARSSPTQALFGIIQGGVYPDLRKRCAEEIQAIGFDGYALGGLSVGEPKDDLLMILSETTPLLPPERPRYLMGVGIPEDIVAGVALGIDMFDCVIPTRSARNGLLFTNHENIVIKRAIHRGDEKPIEESCDCYTCRNFSRAYLRHLYMAGEILAMTLNTIHNIRYFMRLMERIRESIKRGAYDEFRKDFSRARVVGHIDGQ
ncbi:MAG: tRNA guanosine(34) transglycosylase Tgt [Smithellaceae bacterium]|nr:tRNA guanosine(34) transglycosylase Tgt [Smithellaceae bacterium]